MTSIDSYPSPLPARTWPWACGLALIVLFVFGACVRFGFLGWDDPQQVLTNPNVNRPSWHGVEASWRAPYWGLYIPVSYTVLACEAAIGERVDPHSGLMTLRPSVFHLGNLLLHAACTVLVFMLLRRLLDDSQIADTGYVRTDAVRSNPLEPGGSRGLPAASTRRVPATLAAGVGAALFALHPLQVESVAWISEVRGLLCGLFALAALWTYVEYADSRRSMAVRAMLYAGATAALLLALLSKPVAVAVPLMASVLGIGLLRRRPARVLLEILPWLGCAAVAIVGTKRLQPDEAMAFVPAIAGRPLIALDALGFYLARLFLPLELSADYGRTPQFVLGGASFQIGWIFFPLVVGVLLLVKPRRIPLAGCALFLAWLAPVLGLVNFNFQRISTVADRYVYLAMLGPALVVAWIVARCGSRLLLAAMAATLGLLAVLSFLQLGTWRDTRTLFTNALTVNPRSALACYHLGYVAFVDGHHDEAIDWYRQSLEYAPDFVETRIALANALFALGKVDAACTVLREANACGPGAELVQANLQAFQSKRQVLNEAAAEVNMGVAEEAAGRLAQARRHYLAAIRIQPSDAQAHYNLGNLDAAQGNSLQAVEDYETALKFQSEHAQARANLGGVLLGLGRLQEAITQERAALIIDRNLLPARVMLGRALLANGAQHEAAVAFRAALSQVQPGSTQAAVIQDWLRKAESP